jgi:hypothetical protein
MHPAPTWAVYRDAKTGQLIRKYIRVDEAKRFQGKAETSKSKQP